MTAPLAVFFGAGKVACGLLGYLCFQSGYRNLFVARRPEVIGAIERHRGYTVNLLGAESSRIEVRNSRALSIHDDAAVIEAVAAADVVFTSVGIDNLHAVAPHIAAGLWRRARRGERRDLNVVACENLPGAGAYLRHQIVGAAASEASILVDHVGGFSAALTHQIMTGGEVRDGSIGFNVQGRSPLVVDKAGLKPPLPTLQGALFSDAFPSVVMRKLFTLNCAHAVAAYLGYREGCRFVHEAAVHPRVVPILTGALAEAEAALQAEFPAAAAEIAAEVTEALVQIRDPRLADPIARVARGPRRKLAPRERLVGPARLATRHGLAHENLCRAIAATLAYDAGQDAEAVSMQRAIADHGVTQVITEDCGLLPHEPLAQEIKHQWHQLNAQTNGVAVFNAVPTPSLERIRGNVARDLSRRFNPELVQAAVERAAGRFEEARVWSYVEILMKRAALHELASHAN